MLSSVVMLLIDFFLPAMNPTLDGRVLIQEDIVAGIVQLTFFGITLKALWCFTSKRRWAPGDPGD